MQLLQPFGFLPSFHPSGNANPRQKYGSIQTPPAHPLSKGVPVAMNASGFIVPAVTYGATPSDNEVLRVRAIFEGIQYADASGFVKEQPNILAGQPTFASGVSGVNLGDPYSTFVQPYVYQDPQIEFIVQANGPMLQSYLGQTFDIDVTTIDLFSPTGLSLVTLNNAPVAANAGNFIVTELQEDANNQWGDAFTIVKVKFNVNLW